MKTDFLSYEYVTSPFRPDWVGALPPGAKIGLINVRRNSQRLVSEISWGALDDAGSITSGTITIKWKNLEANPTSEAEKQRLYRNAANALNRRLRGVVIEKTDYRPRSSPETLFHEEAQVKPSWLRAVGDAYALFDELRIEVSEGIGFKTFLRRWTESSAEGQIIAMLEAFRTLREFRRQVTAEVFAPDFKRAKPPKNFSDVIPG